MHFWANGNILQGDERRGGAACLCAVEVVQHMTGNLQLLLQQPLEESPLCVCPVAHGHVLKTKLLKTL